MAAWTDENRITKQINAEALVSLRLGARLTQRELAERAGMKPSALCMYEGGRRVNVHPDVIDSLARALGGALGRTVDPDELTLSPTAEPVEVGA